MKVLLLCLAFAAVSLAMPVADEKPGVSAQPPSVAATNTEFVNDQTAPVEEKIAEEATNSEKQPEAKNVPVENKSEDRDDDPEKAPEVKEVVPESKSAAPEPAKEAVEQKPEPSEAVEPKPEEKAVKPEAKSAKESKDSEVPATVNEVPKDAIAKSVVPKGSIDVVSAVKNYANFADDIIMPDELISSPQKKIDLAVVTAAPESEPKKLETSVPAVPPVKTEVSEAEELNADEKPVESAPKSKESSVSEDSLRVVRDTVDDKKADADKNAEPVAEEPKTEAQPSETPKVGEIIKEKKEEKLKDSEPVGTPEATEPAGKAPSAESAPASIPAPAPVPEEAKPQKKEMAVPEKIPQKTIEEKPQGEAPVNTKEESSASGEKDRSSAENDSSEESKEQVKAPGA